jgi:uncharacterized protein YjbJ (UPF0337 family)
LETRNNRPSGLSKQISGKVQMAVGDTKQFVEDFSKKQKKSF